MPKPGPRRGHQDDRCTCQEAYLDPATRRWLDRETGILHRAGYPCFPATLELNKPATADDHIRRRHESPAIGAAVRRQIEGLSRRTVEGDTEALEELAKVDEVLERAIFAGARSLYRFGYTWAIVGECLGITRQAASERFRKPPLE